MRMSLWLIWVTVIDFLVFVVAWGWDTLRQSANQAPVAAVHTAYLIAACAGLVLAVFGFLVLVRGGQRQLARSVVCILFAMIPGCGGLITILSHLGTKTV